MNHLRITDRSQVMIIVVPTQGLLHHRIRTAIVIPALQGVLIQGRIRLTALLQEVVIQGLTALHHVTAGVLRHLRETAEAVQHHHAAVM